MNRLLENRISKLTAFALVFLLCAVGINLLYNKSVSALDKTYIAYTKGTNVLYWNGKDGGWEIHSGIPKVHLDGQSCNTSDSDINFNAQKVYYACSGLIITAATDSYWFNVANLAFRIGDFDSHEKASVNGGRITEKGDLYGTANNPSISIASDRKSAETSGTGSDGIGGCSGGDPNMTEECSILVQFNYKYHEADGGNFRLKLGQTDGGSGHNFYYDGLISKNYQTLTLNPNSGSVADNEKHSDGTLWSHKSGNNVLREYAKGATANEYPTPTRTGYTFSGWYTKANGGTRVTSRTMSSDETLYAHWGKGYELAPTISVDPQKIEAGGTIDVDYRISNNGDADSSNTTWWWLTKSVDGGSETKINGSIGTINIKAGETFNPVDYFDAETADATNQICYTIYAQPQSANDNSAISSTACTTVGTTPKVHVIGGNLKVVGNTNTSTSVMSNLVYGSWAEYSLVVGGNVTGTGSGASLASGSSSGSVCTYNKWTFNNATGSYKSANCNSNTVIGKYSNVSDSIKDLTANFSGGTTLSDTNITPNNLNSGTYNIKGNTSINASTLDQGKSIILKVGGNVTIMGDQKYNDDQYSSAAQIPQLVIIANNITINDNVTTVDAWLLAKSGYIKTCSSELTNSATCNQALTVVGPVIADKLYLYRTAGGEPQTAAEIFNLRADAYLWAYNYASSKGSNLIGTVYTTELPPRF